MRRAVVGAALAAACGAAFADAMDDALVYQAITSRAAEAASTSPRAIEALGGEPIRVVPWWRSSSVSAPLSGRGGGRGGNVASASFTVTGPAESGSRSADVVVLAVAAREKRTRKEEAVQEKEEKGSDAAAAGSRPQSSTSSRPPPAPSFFLLLRSLRRRWSKDGWTLVSAEITLPRPGGAPGPASGVSLLGEIDALSMTDETKEVETDEARTETKNDVVKK